MKAEVPEREPPLAILGLIALAVLIGGSVFLFLQQGESAASSETERLIEIGGEPAVEARSLEDLAAQSRYERIVAAKNKDELWALGEELFEWDPATKDLDAVGTEELRDWLFQDLSIAKYVDTPADY